jgi:CheY-like chemotaxis protein
MPSIHSGVYILVIDDDQADAFLAKHSIRAFFGEGCSVRTLHDTKEALAYLRSLGKPGSGPPPNLIVLDYLMPFGGGETIRQIRGIAAVSHVPVLVLTGTVSNEDICEAYRQGANIAYQKPSDLKGYEVLMTEIANHWLRTARLPFCPGPNS